MCNYLYSTSLHFQVSSECTGRLWGLNREQDLVGPSFEDDNSSSLVPLLSVNIHPPNQKLRFRGFSVGAAGGHHRVVSQDEVVLGNGQVVAKRSSSRAASQFLPKLKSREDAIQLFLSQKRRVHYTPFCEVPEIRSYGESSETQADLTPLTSLCVDSGWVLVPCSTGGCACCSQGTCQSAGHRYSHAMAGSRSQQPLLLPCSTPRPNSHLA